MASFLHTKKSLVFIFLAVLILCGQVNAQRRRRQSADRSPDPSPDPSAAPSRRFRPSPSSQISPVEASPQPSIRPSAQPSINPSPRASIRASAQPSMTPSPPAQSSLPSIVPSVGPSMVSNSRTSTPPSKPTGLTSAQIASNPSAKYIPIAGMATFFTDTETLCLGNGPIPQYAVALNGATGMWVTDYDPKFCGMCVLVWTAKGSFKAVVVDVCDPINCDYNNAAYLDIWGETAFAILGNVIDGIIPITWEWVTC
ncbi:hypothetical protein SmJEL517_g04820 [Synchytrium microbalum]|uniref:RlpA-like protein double-psi beta-barrel domain-containing protein n=1 Tax=Synchytrium microbalum TaxID=1806994 RepID=A0A507C3B3_9FUNG|nr:uncharacterized protein SmJEL517_g04820 [Synchytrium microbalum]TPX32003.1 hypothetical protein SmJEL517_g04820 [Synchytrium microbalum]